MSGWSRVLEGVTLKLDGLADPEEHDHMDRQPTVTLAMGDVTSRRKSRRAMPTGATALEDENGAIGCRDGALGGVVVLQHGVLAIARAINPRTCAGVLEDLPSDRYGSGRGHRPDIALQRAGRSA